MGREDLLEALEDDPADWLGRLALADALAEGGDEALSLRVRSEAWAWAWVEQMTDRGFALAHVGGGQGVRQARFVTYTDEAYEDAEVLLWQADLYESPGDAGNPYDDDDASRGDCPWMWASQDAQDSSLDLPEVWAMAGMRDFCVAVERAGGWWRPAGRTHVEGE